jgi:hypothetical protein
MAGFSGAMTLCMAPNTTSAIAVGWSLFADQVAGLPTPNTGKAPTDQ